MSGPGMSAGDCSVPEPANTLMTLAQGAVRTGRTADWRTASLAVVVVRGTVCDPVALVVVVERSSACPCIANLVSRQTISDHSRNQQSIDRFN